MKCICSGRCWFTGLCIIQLVTVAVRQTFDVLGLQWSCIIINFCQIIATVIGIFGVFQQKRGLLAVYCTWNLLWIGWNILIICVYVGVVDFENSWMILNLAISDSESWFKSHPYVCTADDDPVSYDPTMEKALCFLNYRNIEVFQSSLQLFFSVLGFCVSCYVMGLTKEEDARDHDMMQLSDLRKKQEIGSGPQSESLLKNV